MTRRHGAAGLRRVPIGERTGRAIHTSTASRMNSTPAIQNRSMVPIMRACASIIPSSCAIAWSGVKPAPSSAVSAAPVAGS